ncbi:hypothetical protein G7Y79_00073g098020 [Physcia stellaris]|nr:hypothetical protein G7Y79_00073g098020 [Physcia stellaris]
MHADEMEPKKDGKPFLLDFRSSKWLIAITVYCATFTDGFIYGIIVPVTPFVLVNKMGVPENEVQFWSSTMLAVFGGSSLIISPFIGWFADRSSSRQVPFLLGLLLAFAATLLYTFGKNPATLVAGRCIQGCSVATVFTVGLAQLVDSVERKELGQWIGFVLSGMNMGVMISPFLGGLVYDKAGYYPVCAMGLSVIAFNFLLRLLVVERKQAQRYPGTASQEESSSAEYGTFRDSSTTTKQCIDQDETSESQNGEGNNDYSGSKHDSDMNAGAREEDNLLPYRQATTPPSNGASGTASGLTKYFPVVGLLLTSPKVWTALYGALLHLSIITAFDGVLPLFAKETFGWSSTGIGLIFLAITLPSLLGGVFALGFLALVRDDQIGHIVLLCGLLVLTGTGLNMLLAPLASEMSFVVDDYAGEFPGAMGSSKAYAQTYSLFNCALAGGQFIGPALSGLIYHKTNWGITMGVLAAFCASGAIPVALCTTGPLTPRFRKSEPASPE